MQAAAAELENVSHRYGAVTALDGVDLSVRQGELLALLGPNGAGKSTAISLWLGLAQPTAGAVRLFGEPPQRLSARRRVGLMLQSAGLPETLKVCELLAQTRAAYPDPYPTGDCVDMAGLDGLMGRRYGKLSGGQQRRVQFALAICARPSLLFLDEPTVGLDVEARTALWRTIRTLVADGSAIVLTTHYLEEAEALADRVAVLARGRLVADGSVSQVRARVAQKRIRCISTLDAGIVSAWPEVRSACRDGERIEIVTDAAELVVRQLLFEDTGLAELEVQRAGLAEAFVEITRAAA
ncbi:ABC transporter ATP-binding protein [Dokdonella sp.]|uniref:ABC transporter ATP-binding protein n=1 Tax=Dokdonella sp. TaxID=2291710 RepID=UPI002610B0E4|nr:ABC transporter ATP-binding protein [Dokdonella sp.]